MSDPNAWTDDNGRIHFSNMGGEIVFGNPHEALDALGTWQEFMIFHMLDFTFMPDEAWEMFAEANKN